MKLDIGNIPFVYAPIDTPNNPEGIPDSLPFVLEMRDNVFSQAKSPIIEKALNDAYSVGSVISGQMDDFGNGKEYADEFFGYIEKSVSEIRGKQVLEIGCGTGYLLSKLQHKGADCIGVEPGESADYGKKKFGVNIIRDFFNKNKFDKKFNYIIFYGLLEHIFDIKGFLYDVKELLAEDGMIFIGVPNCTEQISNGDISMLLSEHWSYFTEASLRHVLSQNGLYGNITASASAGVLFAGMRVLRNQPVDDNLIDFEEKTIQDFCHFAEKFEVQKTKIKDYIYDAASNGESVGIYVPGRLICWLNIIAAGGASIKNNLRFIDDNRLLSGTYYPGFLNPIETLEQYLSKPTERLLIASYTYEESIRQKVLEAGYQGVVISIRELLR